MGDRNNEDKNKQENSGEKNKQEEQGENNKQEEIGENSKKQEAEEVSKKGEVEEISKKEEAGENSKPKELGESIKQEKSPVSFNDTGESSANPISAIPNSTESRVPESPDNEPKKDQPFRGSLFKKPSDGIDYEMAFLVSGHGCFNHWVLASSTLIFIHSWMEMVAIGYIITPAECDLRLSIDEKSMVNAAVFMGNCITSIFWGELSDHCGRKTVMLPTAICAIAASFASSLCSSFGPMFLFRLLTGSMISATSAISLVYMGELHLNQYRDKAFSISFVIAQMSFVVLPAFAWMILKGTWSFYLGPILIRPWRVFMWLWGAIGTAGVLILIFLPESPRFILAHQGPPKARPILASIYATNFHKSVEDYPVKRVTAVVENKAENEGFLNVMKEFGSFIKVLCKKPMLRCFFLTHVCMFGTFSVANGLYMWLPDFIQKGVPMLNTSNTMCDLLHTSYHSSPLVSALSLKSSLPAHAISNAIINFAGTVWSFPLNQTEYPSNMKMSPTFRGSRSVKPLMDQKIVPLDDNNNSTGDSLECQAVEPSVYILTILMEVGVMIPYLIVTFMIDRMDKCLLYGTISCLSSLGLACSAFIPHLPTALVCMMIGPINSSCISILSALAMEAFPTKLRALSMGTMYMCGQIGAIVGTGSVALMNEDWCLVILFIIASFIAGGAVALMFLWPNIPDVRKDMESKGFSY